MRPTTRLRAALRERPLTHIIGAHNPLGAMLAVEAGFDGIWASGFELSAAMGVPDASIVSMTQHLEITRAMAAAVDAPVVADIDTGFGNAINVIHAVRQYEAAGAAAVVIEDKHFPKDTSLLAGGRQDLVSTSEYQGKIAAARSARRDADFVVVARTEALIAGLGHGEAMARAHAYVAAGADAVLVHSKQKTPDEIVAFARAWDRDIPLAIVPTAYPQLDEAAIQALRTVRLVIYGNHGVRAIVGALRETFGQIRRERGAAGVDARIPSVETVFEVQGVPAMKRDERRFLR